MSHTCLYEVQNADKELHTILLGTHFSQKIVITEYVIFLQTHQSNKPVPKFSKIIKRWILILIFIKYAPYLLPLIAATRTPDVKGMRVPPVHRSVSADRIIAHCWLSHIMTTSWQWTEPEGWDDEIDAHFYLMTWHLGYNRRPCARK